MRLKIYISTNIIIKSNSKKLIFSCKSCKIKKSYYTHNVPLYLLDVKNISNYCNKSVFELSFKLEYEILAKIEQLKFEDIDLKIKYGNIELDWEYTYIENSYCYIFVRD